MTLIKIISLLVGVDFIALSFIHDSVSLTVIGALFIGIYVLLTETY